jgi:hypothetical protein
MLIGYARVSTAEQNLDLRTNCVSTGNSRVWNCVTQFVA